MLPACVSCCCTLVPVSTSMEIQILGGSTPGDLSCFRITPWGSPPSNSCHSDSTLPFTYPPGSTRVDLAPPFPFPRNIPFLPSLIPRTQSHLTDLTHPSLSVSPPFSHVPNGGSVLHACLIVTCASHHACCCHSYIPSLCACVVVLRSATSRHRDSRVGPPNLPRAPCILGCPFV